MARKCVSSPLLSEGNTVLKGLKSKFFSVAQSGGAYYKKPLFSPGKYDRFLLETPGIYRNFIFQKWWQPWYNKRINRFVAMVRIAKKDYYNNLNVRNITEIFWETVGPFFCKKVVVNEKKLNCRRKKVSDDIEVAESNESVAGFI